MVQRPKIPETQNPLSQYSYIGIEMLEEKQYITENFQLMT